MQGYSAIHRKPIVSSREALQFGQRVRRQPVGNIIDRLQCRSQEHLEKDKSIRKSKKAKVFPRACRSHNKEEAHEDGENVPLNHQRVVQTRAVVKYHHVREKQRMDSTHQNVRKAFGSNDGRVAAPQKKKNIRHERTV